MVKGERSTSIQAAALGLLIGLLSVACGGRSITGGGDGLSSSSGTTSAGGVSSSGGTFSGGGSGAAATGGDDAAAGNACSTPPPCGGDLVGSWAVVSSCLVVSGQLELGILGLGCTTAPVTGSLQVMGTWSANADGTYVDATTTLAEHHIQLTAACLLVSGTQVSCDGVSPIFNILGYSASSCMEAPEGGCLCWATAVQEGGLGVVSDDPSTRGTFSAAGNVVTIDDQSRYAYCVSGRTLTWTPKTLNPTSAGSIELERAAIPQE
jgi:hypothetical protein